MKTHVLLLAACLLPFLPLALHAQTASGSLTNSSEMQESFDPAAATRAWLASVPAEKRAKSDAYFEGGYWLILWNFLLSAAISIFLLSSGLSARVRDFAECITRFKALQIALYMIVYFLTIGLFGFPLTVYADYFREHAYGLSTQSFSLWLREQLVAFTVSTWRPRC